MKKYRLLKQEFIEVCDIKLYRIQALKDFGNVKAGDKGGYIEGEHNLDQADTCWVFRSFGTATIFRMCLFSTKVPLVSSLRARSARNGITVKLEDSM